MKIFHSSKEAHNHLKNPVVALGNFDGVHLAHRKMFELTRAMAKKCRGNPYIYTFDPHPVKVLSPESAPPLITTLSQKLNLIKKSKIKGIVLEPFTPSFAKLSPEAFFEEILLKRLQVKGVVAGYDFTFGAKRAGTIETLERLCLHHGVACRILEAFLLGNTLVSSTQIRNLLQTGHVERASEMLGRPFEIVGTVIRGEGVGASIGFPTINLWVENELIPSLGVYATRVRWGRRRHHGVTNIGFRPTFGGNRLTVETHLLRFKGRLYGKKIRLEFIQRIREERMFPTVAALVGQIEKDVDVAKKILR